jgi:hypothetical protein
MVRGRPRRQSERVEQKSPPFGADVGNTALPIVRVVCNGRTAGEASAAERILHDALTSKWPSGVKVKFVLTPGGFVRGPRPRNRSGSRGWDSNPRELESLTRLAEQHLRRTLSDRVLRAARDKAEVITVGIDLYEDDATPHAELVAVYDVGARRVVRWTGKSYPTPYQERTLIHVRDLSTHLVEVAGERVLVLGCHDLSMFNPRGRANQSPHGVRRARCDEMRSRVAEFRPTVVLQHPHSTDSPNIWRLAWLSLLREVPSVRAWASGISYFHWAGRPRAPMRRVLELTRVDGSQVRDIVVQSSDYRCGR